jgi:hypothetical protein
MSIAWWHRFSAPTGSSGGWAGRAGPRVVADNWAGDRLLTGRGGIRLDLCHRRTCRCLHRRAARLAAGHLRQVRDLVHAADSEVCEAIKWTRQPYFVLQGTSVRCWPPRTMSTYSSTTAASFLTPTGSLPQATATRPPAPWPSAKASPSARPRSAPCSGTSQESAVL